ncbi:MAG: molybdenum cofactor biosynthesis protein MoaE [Nitrospinota bacterium]|nr:molybdenum cofactor biosynthesis protein MoaE [Nitrospinota bacterium]MDP7369546.1 molybdenum cofactor biosynthesis protein MoaE [Nitrospinota bacterium]MDP7503312.1 molybdenum cofactor biosynthesis protein MoaE [Nitrospinota bacterium]MDP7663088.1 molybdenum cofactor biosynthesis protein MoaE [Nitrospinota bacterium]
MICRIVETPVDMDTLIGDVAEDDIGGVCTFIGLVRNHSRGQRVTHLEYHAYPEMSEKKMRQVIEEVSERFGVDRIAMEHRIGTLQIGEIAVGIAAASAHRDASFKACRYAIDRIKQIVPIWKKEFGEDGAVWVEECSVDAETA